MNAPAVVILLQLEQSVRVYYDVDTDGEKSRLTDWLRAHSEYARLVADAIELLQREQAA